jgi:hypothetical protein
MTEAEWLGGQDFEPLLAWLGARASQRKLRLWACACCRLSGGLHAPALRTLRERASAPIGATLEVAERFAEGDASAGDLEKARSLGDGASWWAAWDPAWIDGSFAARAAIRACGAGPGPAVLLREVFGNPFRPVAVDPAWLRWNDGTVAKLASVIHDERRFADLPVLADALEEAGCSRADLLGHCRAGGHVLGCWALDALAGKV